MDIVYLTFNFSIHLFILIRKNAGICVFENPHQNASITNGNESVAMRMIILMMIIT
jgi:hypothetical protein